MLYDVAHLNLQNNHKWCALDALIYKQFFVNLKNHVVNFILSVTTQSEKEKKKAKHVRLLGQRLLIDLNDFCEQFR